MKNLKSIRSYANKIGVTVQWVYRLAEQGKIKLVEIDGIKFIKDEHTEESKRDSK